jgi:hypothetical protein
LFVLLVRIRGWYPDADGRIKNVKVRVEEPEAEFNVILDVHSPTSVGTPEMTPVVPLIDKPGGSPCAENVYGPPPTAANDALYAWFTVPKGIVVLVVMPLLSTFSP